MKKEKENLEVEAFEMADKKHMILKMLFGVLAFIVVVASCFGAGYFGSKLGNKEKENKEEKEEPKKEVKTLTVESDEVKKLYEVFREDKDCSTASYWSDYSLEDAKVFFAYRAALKESSMNIRCGDLDHSYVGGYYCAFPDKAEPFYGNEDIAGFENAIKDEKTIGVTVAVLEAKYKELFGKDASFSKGNIHLGLGPILYYDKVNQLYAEFGCQCGGECAGVTQTLDSISQDGKKLILNTTIVENFDRITTYYVSYTFEFEEETGNYIFVGREEKKDSKSVLIARSAELIDNFNSLLDGFICVGKEHKFSETGDNVLYKVKEQEAVKDLINDTFVNTSVASKYVPYYEKNGVVYTLNGSGGIAGAGDFIFEYNLVSEENNTAVVDIKYIECYDEEEHDKIAACQNNPWDKIFSIKLELKKVNDTWLIEKIDSDLIVPVTR